MCAGEGYVSVSVSVSVCVCVCVCVCVSECVSKYTFYSYLDAPFETILLLQIFENCRRRRAWKFVKEFV